MTLKKVATVIDFYQTIFRRLKVKPRKFPEDRAPKTASEVLSHLYAMTFEMKGFIKERRREKFMRWLGFMQGAFWTQKLFTLEELKNHNRPVRPQKTARPKKH